MKRGLAGRYQISRTGDEEARTFIPHPLPPDPPVDLANGRQRLLERATLALGRLDSVTLLLPDPNVFLYLKQHRAEYYRLLDLVRTEGDWEAWLDFFLEAVADAAGGAVQTAQRLVGLFNEDGVRVRSRGRSATTALRVFDALKARPLISLNDARRRAGMSFPTATKGMAALVDLGIARELTGQRRNRVFAYQRYLAILNEGADPL